MEQKKQIFDEVNKYLANVFDMILDEIPDDGIIDMAYTTVDFDNLKNAEIQVKLDINNLKWLNYINDELVLEQDVSADDIINNISDCDFDTIIYDCLNVGYNLYDNK